MPDTTTITLETERLLLVSIAPAHREDIFREFTKEITVYMFPQPTGDIADINAFIEESLAEMKAGSNLQLVALDKQTKEFLGCMGLHHIDTKTPEMGIWLKKSAHGNKYGQEAMAAIKRWADAELEYDYILYPAGIYNIASRKVAESLGGKLIRQFTGKNQLGEPMEEVEYRIYKDSNK